MIRNISSALLISLLMLSISGCITSNKIGPLELSEFRSDIVIRQDNSILIENDVIDFRIFREELNKRMITDQSRIVVHVHESVSAKVFAAVRSKLVDEGFKQLEYKMYKD